MTCIIVSYKPWCFIIFGFFYLFTILSRDLIKYFIRENFQYFLLVQVFIVVFLLLCKVYRQRWIYLPLPVSLEWLLELLLVSSATINLISILKGRKPTLYLRNGSHPICIAPKSLNVFHDCGLPNLAQDTLLYIGRINLLIYWMSPSLFC